MTTDVNLIQLFELSVEQQNYQIALETLCLLLNEADSSGHHFTESRYFSDAITTISHSKRVNKAIISLFTDVDFILNWSHYGQLINHLKGIIAILKLGQLDAIPICQTKLIQQLETLDSDQLVESQVYKILLMTSLAELDKNFFNWLTELDSRVATPFILALLGLPNVVIEKEHLSREQLLSFGPVINQQPLDFSFSGLFAVAWMHTSYALRADKHLFKGYLNQLMRKTLENNQLIQPKIKQLGSNIKKPKLLVVAEIFSSNHAMSRCYQNYILQLSTQFHITLITSENAIDDDTKVLFDKLVTFSFEDKSINQIAEIMFEQEADIVYYPSLGMATWTVMLATYRFAPIQIAATGHPATSLSNAIDYLIGPEFLFYNTDLYSEKLLCIGDNLDATHVPPINEHFPKAKIRKNPKHLCIAINAISFKLNAAFLSICQQIESQSTRKISWRFFSNQVGLQHYALQQDINQWLKQAKLVKSLDFNQDLEQLNQCDVALSPFPFGGSNSNIDLLRLGIPLVFLTGEEAHARTDEFYFGYFNLTEGLVSNSVEAYLQNALKLIDENNHRIQISNKILKSNPDKLILNKTSFNKTDVVDAVRWIYHNHQQAELADIKKITTDFRLKQHFQTQSTTDKQPQIVHYD